MSAEAHCRLDRCGWSTPERPTDCGGDLPCGPFCPLCGDCLRCYAEDVCAVAGKRHSESRVAPRTAPVPGPGGSPHTGPGDAVPTIPSEGQSGGPGAVAAGSHETAPGTLGDFFAGFVELLLGPGLIGGLKEALREAVLEREGELARWEDDGGPVARGRFPQRSAHA